VNEQATKRLGHRPVVVRPSLTGPDALESLGRLHLGQPPVDVGAETLRDRRGVLARGSGPDGLASSSIDDATAPMIATPPPGPQPGTFGPTGPSPADTH
jgi:hypothetical protein